MPTADLIYVRGPGAEHCPGEMELRLAVVARLGYDPFHAGPRRRALVVLRNENDKLVARLNLVGEDGVAEGERELEAKPDRCADLVRVLALSLSIAIDPDRLEPTSDEPPSAWRFQRTPGPPRAPERPTDAAAAVANTGARENSRFGLLLGLGAQAAWGVTPGTAIGALLGGSARVGWVSLGLETQLDFPSSERLAQGGSFASRLLSASLVPCVHFAPGLACVLGSLGSVSASSRGIFAPRDDDALYVAAGVRLAADWPLGGAFALRSLLDAHVPFTRTTIHVDRRTVWKAPAYSGAIGAMVIARLP